MSLLSRIKGAIRTLKEDPSYTQNRILYVPSKTAGVSVNHHTALQYATVFACIRVISEDIAKLPWEVTKTDSSGKQRTKMRGHPVWTVLNRRANVDMASSSVKETLVSHALTWGNGYAEIERDGANRTIGLWPLTPERVEVKRDESNRLVYEVTNQRGGKTNLPPDDIFHIHGLGFDGMVGYSVIALARRTIGTGLAADEFSASFYGNGTVVGSTIEHPGKLGDKALKNLKESVDTYRKGPSNAFKPFILEEGMKFNNITVPAKDAQFLESNQFRVEEICRWFRVPPHKVAHLLRATFSNIEHQSIEYVEDTLMPWINRLEEEADYKLFGRNAPSTVYTKINVNALLRGDQESRSKFYREMASLGVYSINDILELEDMSPIADGDSRLVPVNMTTLEKLISDPDPMTQQLSVPDDDRADTPRQLAATMLAETELRALKREDHRIRDALTRYTDRDDFIRWMDSFFPQQTRYRTEQIGRTMGTLADAYECEPPPMSEILDEYGKAMAGMGRLIALEHFNNELPDAPLEKIAAERANILIDRLFVETRGSRNADS